MASFAVVKNKIVENIVECEEPQVLPLLIPDADEFVEVTEETGYPYIGAEYRLEKFVPPQPFKSWSFSEDAWQWLAPASYPDDGKAYEWNEISKKWEIINA